MGFGVKISSKANQVGIIAKKSYPYQNLTDEELVSLALAQDRKAQEAIYLKYGSIMYSVCLRYARTKEDANDLVQEGFIKVFTKLHTFKGESQLNTWMTRIFINSALTYLKKGTQKYTFLEYEEYESVLSDEEEGFEVDESFFELSSEDALMFIQMLPDKYRMIINMYCVDGFTHKQIAEELMISEGTSKSQLSRARKMLLKLIEKKSKRVGEVA